MGEVLVSLTPQSKRSSRGFMEKQSEPNGVVGKVQYDNYGNSHVELYAQIRREAFAEDIGKIAGSQ